MTTVLQTLGSYHPHPKPNSEGSWGAASCPLAPWQHKGRDEHPSLMVSLEPGRSIATCLGCGFSSGLLGLAKEVHRYGGIDDGTLKELTYLIVLEEAQHWRHLERHKPDLPAVLVDDLEQWHPYWEERGFDHDDVRRWRLGYSAEERRVLIPFFCFEGNLRGVVGRDITGLRSDKYRIYPEGFDRSRYLFGEHLVSGNEDALLVTEGYLDAIAARKHVPASLGVVALGTARPSDEQVRKIVMFANGEVIIGLDPDSAGMIGATKLERLLRGRVRLSRIDYGKYHDAAEAGPALPNLIDERKGGLFEGVISRLADIAEEDESSSPQRLDSRWH